MEFPFLYPDGNSCILYVVIHIFHEFYHILIPYFQVLFFPYSIIIELLLAVYYFFLLCSASVNQFQVFCLCVFPWDSL